MNYRALAVQAARRYGLNPSIFLRQINQESGFNPRARSSAGALGIAQFMPATARGMGVNPLDPRSALMGAARMDAQNLHKFGNWQDVLSSYNSGRPWAQGRGIAQTRNYVSTILGGAPAAGRAPGAGAGVPGIPLSSAPAPDMGASRRSLALNLIQASQATSAGQAPDYSQTFSLLSALQGDRSRPAQLARSSFAESTNTRGRQGNLRELFYDPLGAVKNGRAIPAIGGHSDHVHVALGRAVDMVSAMNQARAMGLHVSENPYVGVVHHVHVANSNHYRVLGTVNGRTVGGAADVSGSPRQMAAYFHWIRQNF